MARRGSEVRLILVNKDQQQDVPIPNLVRAVVQAKNWYDWIITGEIRTMRELAKRTGFNENYVPRILQLATLSPDWTEAVLKGDHSPLLTVAQVTKNVEMDWSRQSLYC